MDNFIPVAEPNLTGNELKYIKECVETNWISSKGEYVDKFEKNFSDYCDVKYGVATSNGTTALHLALEALEIGKGDEVIIPDLTFAATINAVLYTGATPVLVDINKDSWNIDVEKIRSSVTNMTKAIIPVHLYGQPCDMNEILDIANKYDLYVIEDCAEAHGAEYKNQKVGSFGDISCFSFYGNKIITTGEGGMCLTDDSDLNNKMKILRDHGMNREKKYIHQEVGFNYRMTNMQAGIGVAQLERINNLLMKRQELLNEYNNHLKDIKGITLQKEFDDRKKVCWMYSILINEYNYGISRDRLIKKLKKHNIDSRPFFHPLHKMNLYKGAKKYNKIKKSHKISKSGINLPTLVDIDKNQIENICALISSWGK